MPQPSESTPLIQVVSVRPPRDRYPHTTLRRFCTIALLATLIAVVLLFLIPIRWLPHPKHDPFHHHHPWDNLSFPDNNPYTHRGLSYEKLQKLLLATPDGEKAKAWSKYYTSGPHLAGKNLSQAEWTRDRWQEFGVKQSEVVAYDVYINYPLGHRLALLEGSEGSEADATKDSKYSIKHEFNLEEDVVEDDETTGLEDRIPTFHGYSASGNVTAQYVFVNFGTYADFEDLVKANVSLSRKIAVAKYGKIFRGLKIKRAEELGMIGVVLYSDPEEDGEIIEQNGYKAYPDGPARNPSAVQRGSVQFLSKIVSCSQSLAHIIARSSTRGSYDPRLPFITGSAQARACINPQDSIPSDLVRRGRTPAQSIERVRTKSRRLQRALARRQARI